MTMTRFVAAAVCLFFAASAFAQPDGDVADVFAKLPVREIIVFKDGHALMLHQGTLPTDESGDVRLDELPKPVMGTFWPYSAQNGATLRSVTAAQHSVSIERTALSVRELLEANIGAQVVLRDAKESYTGMILDVPRRSSDELAATSAPGTGPHSSQAGQILLLKTDAGTQVIPIDSVRDVTFVNDPVTDSTNEELRNVLTLGLDWTAAPAAEAEVGLSYLQRGIRWIPQYRITLGDDGEAVVELQATLLNELTDLENVTAHLVIGVPSFDFKETVDPIALSDSLASLSQYFRDSAATQHGLSNSIMIQTQSARMGDFRAAADVGAENLGPDLAGGQHEDLYVFTLEGISLTKGGRMVVPVGRWSMPFEDLYKLQIPLAPPVELQQQFANQQQAELAQLFHAPKVKHVMRLHNDEQVPLTTAPALIVGGDRVLGQGMMTYTSPGASVDLEITTAVNISVKFEESESSRTPNAANFANTTYDRIDVAGTIKLTNYRGEPARIEVERLTLGLVDEAGQDGTVTRIDPQHAAWSSLPNWWRAYHWPGWWHHLNTVSRIRWNVEIPSGESMAFDYRWHYFWRY